MSILVVGFFVVYYDDPTHCTLTQNSEHYDIMMNYIFFGCYMLNFFLMLKKVFGCRYLSCKFFIQPLLSQISSLLILGEICQMEKCKCVMLS